MKDNVSLFFFFIRKKGRAACFIDMYTFPPGAAKHSSGMCQKEKNKEEQYLVHNSLSLPSRMLCVFTFS